MKGFRSTFPVVLILLGAVVLCQGQKKKGSDEDESNVSSKERQNSVGGFRGTCSCRDMEAQMEHMEVRLDRMIELWNDFVDKNRDPYSQPRRPGQGGLGPAGPNRGPYFERDRQGGGGGPPPRPRPGAGRYMDRGDRSSNPRGFPEDDQDGGPRRFRF